MEQLLEYRQRLLSSLRSSAEDLIAILAKIPDDQYSVPVEADGWSAHQIVTHLRDKEAQAYLPRMRQILFDSSPCLESFSGEDWMKAHYRAGEPVQDILLEYQGLRNQELDLLENLPGPGWSRMGRHPAWGVRTLQWWAEQSLSHTRTHIGQLRRW